MSRADHIVRAFRAPSKETQRPLWILNVVMICGLLVFRLVWAVWEPGETRASRIFTWIWLGVLLIGVSAEVTLRLRARLQRRTEAPAGS